MVCHLVADISLSEIDSLISTMNMFEIADTVLVTEKDNEISFEWFSPVNEKYCFKIIKDNENVFRCIKTSERNLGFSSELNKDLREKTATEEIVTLESSGFISIIENNSIVYNTNKKIGACDNTVSSERKYYTNDGIMRDRQYKGYKTGELTEDFDRVRTSSMLYIPRQAFGYGFWHNNYETTTILTREKLDIARIYHEDKAKGIRYSSKTVLNSEYGLRDMNLQGGNPYPLEATISPISKNEIELLIKKERNQKVMDALRKLSAGRENYYYNSNQDPNFVCEGITDGMTR